MAYVLDSLKQNFGLAVGGLDQLGHILHAEHDDGHVQVLELVVDLIRLANYKLVVEEFVHALFFMFHLILVFSTASKLFGEHYMISYLLADGLFDLVTFQLHGVVLDHIVHIQFVPVLLPLVKDNRVSEMQERCVVSSKIFMHHSFVDNNLTRQFAISPIIVKLERLDELVLVVGVPLESLDDGHAPLVGLDDIHGEVFHIVLVVLGDEVTPYCDVHLVFLVVLAIVILTRQIEK